jgi:hypothetical protein
VTVLVCHVAVVLPSHLRSYYQLPICRPSFLNRIPIVSCSAFVSCLPICTKSIFIVFNNSHQCRLPIPPPLDVHHTACFYAFCTCASCFCACMAYAVLSSWTQRHTAAHISDSITCSHMSPVVHFPIVKCVPSSYHVHPYVQT